ncbi:protein ERGIC-53 isoform X2 [Procambarus clarkii]|uniref:protein ERGIC-53 isoform X2 n=1 Tax=Procambarus clarkii TaxID=6728 RepID=UPI001E671513|nr:protein ERGIC-53-like isoform X2 [Procambarus clarkii]
MDLWWTLTILLPLICYTNAQNPHKRFEYKYSFKGPYLAQKDNQVPFWQYSGNAIASEESVRITPSLRSQKGQIWTKNPTNFEWWEVDFVFRVTGRGRIGADGLAIWFADKPGVEGPVFGSSDQWNGLGIFFDSFDNDNKRNNPYVMAMVNDGSKIYDHEHDGLSQQLGGCLRDFRNKPFPVRAKIEYYKNVLTVKTQLLEFDYSKLEERDPDIDNITLGDTEPFSDSLTTTYPVAAETTLPPVYDEYPGTTSQSSDIYSTAMTYFGYEEEATSSSPDSESTTTTASTILGDGFTRDGLDTSHLFMETVHVAGEEELSAGRGWYGSSEPTAATTTPKPEKKKRRKRQRKRRTTTRRRRKRVHSTSPLMIHSGMTNNEKDYEICMRAENVFLPATGHFGVSAATGGLADDHDVLKFLVSSMRSPEEMALLQTNQEDEEKFRQEFQEYQEKTKKARDEYIALNPDAVQKDKEEEYESWEQRELRQIFHGQSQIHEIIRQLHSKMDEIIGRQERTLGLVSAVHSGMGGQVMPAGQVPPAPVAALPGDTIRRHEVDNILNNQRDIVQTARDIKNFVNEIHQKSNLLLSNSQKPQGSVQPVGFDLHVTLNEMKEGLNTVKRDLGTATQRLSSAPGGGACPTVSCVSTGLFIAFMVIQLVLLIGYIMYRDNKEAQAKKFY